MLEYKNGYIPRLLDTWISKKILFLKWLPEKEKYLPPITIHVKDNRAFGRQVLCGTHVIDTLHKYFMDPKLFEPRRPPEPEGTSSILYYFIDLFLEIYCLILIKL